MALAVLIFGILVCIVGPAVASPMAPSTSSCTYGDSSQPGIPAGSAALVGVVPGDTLTVSCSGLPPSVSVQVTEQSPLAAVIIPSSLAVDERSDAGPTTAMTDTSGSLASTSYALPVGTAGQTAFAATDPLASCPPTQAQVDAGLVACSLVVVDASTGVALDQAQLVYAVGQPVPSAPSLTLSARAGANGDVVSVSDAPGSVSYWWGNAAGTSIPASNILVGTTAAASSTVTVSAVSYTVPLDSSSAPLWTSAVLSPPSLSGSFSVPAVTASGATSVSLLEPDANPGIPGNSSNISFPGALAASAAFTVIDTGDATLSVNPADGGTGSAIVVTGGNWDPQGGTVMVEFSQVASAPFNEVGTDKASATVQANGAFAAVLLVGPSETLGLTGPDSVYVVASQQTVTGSSPSALDEEAPFTLEVGCAAVGPCSELNSLSAQVSGTTLSMTELPGQGSTDPTHVALSAVSLNGQFTDATGELSSVLVTDSRGTLSGWSVTGQLEGPFENSTPVGSAVDNQIPADYLTWNPSVSLQTTGSGASGSLSEVHAGAEAPLTDTSGNPVSLCSAAAGGGGGSFVCAASVTLAIPPQVAAGTYTNVLNIVLIGF